VNQANTRVLAYIAHRANINTRIYGAYETRIFFGTKDTSLNFPQIYVYIPVNLPNSHVRFLA